MSRPFEPPRLVKWFVREVDGGIRLIIGHQGFTIAVEEPDPGGNGYERYPSHDGSRRAWMAKELTRAMINLTGRHWRDEEAQGHEQA